MYFRAATAARSVIRAPVPSRTPASLTQPSRTLPLPTPFRQKTPTPSTRRNYYHLVDTVKAQKSGSGFGSAAVVFGIAIGSAVVYSLIRRTPTNTPSVFPETTSATFDLKDYTDSYLIMASNMPPGRVGTLTPDQEAKLRDLWALTLKTFGVYEAPETAETEVADTASTTAAAEPTESGKKEKASKRSRLNVFKKKDKGEKGTDAETASATSSPTDISSLSIADEDDKHGQNKDFKSALANSSPEDLRKTFWSMVKHDHPDALLLRFLRARKWDVEKALVMMISTMHWRQSEQHVDDDVMMRGELYALQQSKSSDPKEKKEGEDFLAQLRMGKSFLHGLDKEGRPMCVVRVRLHKGGEQQESSLERFTVYTIETARMVLRPPVDTATIVFDMTSFSMANMDYTPVKFMIKCFEANYPESLGAVLVYKAPWLFNAVWNVIRGWLDPVVAGKVHFVKTPEDLEAYVPKSQILSELGGDEKWEYTYVEPVEGENDAMKDTATRDRIQAERDEIVKNYESTILSWIHSGEAPSTRNEIAEELRANYWKIDPYVRARTLYDRTGVIQQGGKLDFYPKETGSSAPSAGAPTQANVTSEEDLD